MSIIRDYLDLVASAITDLPEDKLQDIVDTLKDAYADGRQVFFLGNGGSATTASHLACDLQKGMKECTGRKFRVTTVSDSMALVTAWANDSVYENIFAEQIDSLVQPRDVVVAISGSGNSKNVINAVRKANELGAITIGWCGFGGGKLAEVAQKSIVVNSDNMQRVEDTHLVIGHLIFTCMMKQCKPG